MCALLLSGLFNANILFSGAGLSTTGLWHYPANITDSSIATEFAQFSAAASDGFKTVSTAGVINKIQGREQVCVAHLTSI